MKQLNVQEYYNLDKEGQTEYLAYVERKIKREKQMNPLFYEMMQEVKRDVQNYTADFYVHDFNAMTLDRGNTSRFLWDVRETGTWMVRLNNDFREESDAHYENFLTLRDNEYNFDPKTTKTFIIDISTQSIKQVDPFAIDKSYFKDIFGNVFNYFKNQTEVQQNHFDNYCENWRYFKHLLYDFNNHPPKYEVDKLIDNPL